MSLPFVAEIRMFGCNFAPTGWAQCDGQLISIAQNTALFSLLGTAYGGDGQSTFGLPNLQGSVPVNAGQGPGLSVYLLGQSGGSESVTLLPTEMPNHSHAMMASSQPGEDATPTTEALARSVNASLYQPTANANVVPLSGQAVAPAGSSLPHNNMMPYLVINFCIALQGVFPQRG